VRRLRNLYLILCALLLVEAGRLFHLQVLSAEEDYEGRARSRLYAEETVDALRGEIRDRRGLVLAQDRPRYDLMAAYDLLTDPAPWLADVSEATGLPPDTLRRRAEAVVARVRRIRRSVWRRRRARRPDRPLPEESVRIREMVTPHVLVPGVDLRCAAEVESQPDRFAGFHIRITRARVYPEGRLACHVLGHLGPLRPNETPPPAPAGRRPYRPGDSVGKTGIERQYDAYLRGKPGRRLSRINLEAGRRECVYEDPARQGDTVWLSLDARVQAAAEKALGERTGAVAVMDVRTGAVIALASSPGYDLGRYGEALPDLLRDAGAPLLNRAVKDPVSLGSVMKVVVAVAALQERKLSPSETLHCAGAMHLGRDTRYCAGRYAHGDLTVAGAIEHSCNIFFFRTGLRLGPRRLVRWARAFGLGRRTGVDLPYEWAGRVPDPDWHRARHGRPWYPGDTLNLSIGQGDVQVTPLQVAVMMAAVANGGRVLRPRLALRVTDPAGRAEPLPPLPEVVRRLDLDGDLLDVVRKGMRRVPITGTARYVKGLADLRVAGKTGTADLGKGLNNAWFAGFAPWNAPEVSFAVGIHRTQGHGAGAAAPVAAAVLRAYFAPEDAAPAPAGAEEAAP